MESVIPIEESDHYIINSSTIILYPMNGNHGEYWTIALDEDYKMFLIKEKPLTVIDRSCTVFGSSYSGRREGAAKLMNYNYMIPIAINGYTDVVVFPLSSPKNRECIWLSHKHIIEFRSLGSKTMVYFRNRFVQTFDIKPSSFESKLLRTAQFRCMLHESAKYYQNHLKSPFLTSQQVFNLGKLFKRHEDGTFEPTRMPCRKQ
ncbi:hypothetical protein GCM10011391_01430 [Pullulanibacillus camelliae]|uniref:Transcriptional regulator n=1 Tax=Pullulanibacillus camelliae TaxID=1707096 RepID=A0A8J2YET9_9BACL|nr:competence protein ComK [Pullulanibacillus camelliae]GGE26806.1 hypothetical protein GCM10011391_01430 [Pullulanibacillus camelliae]